MKQFKALRLFEVFYSGKDEYGCIAKSISIMALSEKDAMDKANDLNSSNAIYSATESKVYE